ncbi:hypothetical protein ETW23_03960 [Leisingera sp. NJS201]|uniref:DUF7220 family protein n=1 Tax=Leisingera sp. NJS201 TaxID=2508306 RepID=UPI001070D934|nr:hypothetical protein [Leisingera sp. NJS201]QBR35421.1 hypothetical protein ETW23_03960 [Leisingera sp. NJS201]
MAAGQSRRGSLLEALANVVLGWGVAVLANLAVLPAFGLPVTPGQAAGIGAAFSAISLCRSYVLRRIFERFGKQNGTD